MGKKMQTFTHDSGSGAYCEIHANLKEEYFYIKYFNAEGKLIVSEDFINKSISYVESAAENWCMGIKTNVPV